MGPIGVPEMLFILAVALLIFGPKRLPELGRTIGKALGEFRRATTDLKRSIDVEMSTVEPPTRPAPAPRPAPSVPREATPNGADESDDEDEAAEADETAAIDSEDAEDAPSA